MSKDAILLKVLTYFQRKEKEEFACCKLFPTLLFFFFPNYKITKSKTLRKYTCVASTADGSRRNPILGKVSTTLSKILTKLFLALSF